MYHSDKEDDTQRTFENFADQKGLLEREFPLLSLFTLFFSMSLTNQLRATVIHVSSAWPPFYLVDELTTGKVNSDMDPRTRISNIAQETNLSIKDLVI